MRTRLTSSLSQSPHKQGQPTLGGPSRQLLGFFMSQTLIASLTVLTLGLLARAALVSAPWIEPTKAVLGALGLSF